MPFLAGRKPFFALLLAASLSIAAQESSKANSSGAQASASQAQADPKAGSAQTSGTLSNTSSPQINSAAPQPAPSQSSPAAQNVPSRKQSEETPAMPATVLKVTTRLVLVDTVVTDGSGRPITDLKPNDFEIRENGKPQKISAFNFQGVTAVSADANRSAPTLTKRTLPPGIFTNIPDFHPEAGPPTVLLIDALNTSLKDQPYVRQQLVKYLQTVEPRRNVAIYTLGSRLRLLQDFTTDPELLQAAMKKLTMHSSSLNEDPDTQPEMNIGDPNDPSVAQMEQSIMQFEAEEESFRNDMKVIYTMEALKQIARNVAGYPGRKNLIWLSGAFPLTILPDTSLPNAFGPMRQYGDQIHETASIMTDAEIAIYPVDARGLVGSFMPDASSSGRDRFGRSRTGPALAAEMSRRSSALVSSHDSMNELAEQTGGRAYYNRNDIDHAVALGVADGSNYYTLAYYPEDKNWDGKFRKIEVKVGRKGAHARQRKGYYATDPSVAAKVNEKAARGEFLNALTPEAPNATMLPFVARVTPPNKADPATLVDFSVEPHAIAFEANGSLEHAQLDFITRAFDAKGKLINNQSDTLTADLKPETYANVMKSGLRIRQKINLTPGKYLLKVGVRDTRTNLIGTISAQIEVPQS